MRSGMVTIGLVVGLLLQSGCGSSVDPPAKAPTSPETNANAGTNSAAPPAPPSAGEVFPTVFGLTPPLQEEMRGLIRPWVAQVNGKPDEALVTEVLKGQIMLLERLAHEIGFEIGKEFPPKYRE